MRRIEKGREPACLATLRADLEGRAPTAADWGMVHGDQKQQMRDAAFAEQNGLCAYCASRLSDRTAADESRPDKGGMKIEHWAARNAVPSRLFDWENLLGVCPGVVIGGDEQGTFHCDAHRGHLGVAQQGLHHNPNKFPPDVATFFRYTTAGEVLSDDAGARLDVERLNLNIRRPKRARAAAQAIELWRDWPLLAA
jgi:uncharacterized protein (TIGR02646 family)